MSGTEPALSKPAATDRPRATIARLALADEAATRRLGQDLSRALKRGDVVALEGDLGAGKSTLARAAIRALAGADDLDVPSPTFTLVQTYETTPPVAHFDLYRLGDAAELDELGFDEAAEDGVVFLEWPQRAPAALARADIRVCLETSPDGGRFATIEACPEAETRLARSLAIRAFLAEAGLPDVRRRTFTGDASARRYETVAAGEDGTVLVLMDSPRQPDGPPIRDGLPYSRIAHLAEDVVPFVAVANALTQAGFAAPAIRHADLSAGLLLLDHLGSETLLDAEGRPVAERYEAAVLCLADLHAAALANPLPVPGAAPYEVPDYDRRAMGIEVELVLDWYMPRVMGRAASASERALFGEIWDGLFDELRAAETGLVLRDFHSPNVIWRPEETGARRIGIIDFQDAVIGPVAYDVASLAQDARVTISPELEARLVSAYIARRRGAAGFEPFEFERAYAIMGAQRASKILGIFVRLLERDGKPQYLRHIPRIRAYLTRTLGHPSLAALAALYADWGLTAEDGDDTSS